MPRTLVVAALAVGACAAPVQPLDPAAAQGRPAPPSTPGTGGGGPALGVFPRNQTRVTAKVLREGTAAAEYLPSQPDIAEGTRLYSLTLEILAVAPARADVAMGPAAGVIEALSREPVAADLVGRRIEAVVTLVGTTHASRWLISDIRALPE